jgi:large subunit ribosomal protein L10
LSTGCKKNTYNLAARQAGLKIGRSSARTSSLATHETDLVAPAKIIVEFAKKHEAVEIKSGFVEGK